MAKQADTGVYQLRNGNWAFRYTLTENGNKKDVRRSKNENGQKLRSMREAIVARYTKNIHFLSIHFWGWTGLHRRKNCHFYATFTGPDRKKEAPGGCFLCSFSVFPGYPGTGSFLLESILAQTAGGADPIRRDLLPGGSGSDAVLGIAYRGIIDVAAGANILIHDSTFFHSIRSSASAGPRKPCRDGPHRGPSHGRYREWHPDCTALPAWPARTCPEWHRSRRQHASQGSSWCCR